MTPVCRDGNACSHSISGRLSKKLALFIIVVLIIRPRGIGGLLDEARK